MTDYTRAAWLPETPSDRPVMATADLPRASPPGTTCPPAARQPSLPTAPRVASHHAEPEGEASLTEAEYEIVEDVRDRVSTRLTMEDKNYPAAARRELTRKLIRDEYDQRLLHEANRGRTAPAIGTEEQIFAAVLAELDGLGRMAPLLARNDVEDIHFEGCDPIVLRLDNGQLVSGPPIAGTDAGLEQLLRSIGARSGDGQTSREFSSAAPIMNVRLKGVTELGGRLQAAMDVLPRPAGVIRVHRFSDPSLADLRANNMIDTAMQAFLHHAILAGASPLISGNPGVGKTTMMRALGNTIPYNNVVICVEDERELGLHLLRWDAERGERVRRHAVSRSFESRVPNGEGKGAFGMGDALNEALRASPTWVLVGEVRGGYVTSLLDAATSGIASVMCTIHARSADGVFKKVRINALKANPPPDTELIMDSISELDLVIHIEREEHDGRWYRYVSGIYELGRSGDSTEPTLTGIFKPRRKGERPVATGSGMLSDDLRQRLEATGFNAQHWLDESRSDWRDIPRSGCAS